MNVDSFCIRNGQGEVVARIGTLHAPNLFPNQTPAMKTNFNFNIQPIANGFLVHASKVQDIHRGYPQGQVLPEPVFQGTPAEVGKFITETLKAEQARQAAIEQAQQTLAEAR